MSDAEQKPRPLGRGVVTKAKERAEAVIAAWQDAFRKANGKEPPSARYESGWIKVRGSAPSAVTRYRIAELEANAERLRTRVAEDA